MHKRFVSLLILLGALSVSYVTASAQVTGAIKGQITDQQGSVVPGAPLTLTSPDLQGQRTVVSDSDGNYVFIGLPPGVYKITVNKDGFQPFQQEGLQLRVALTLTADLRLTVAGVSQSVNVTTTGEDTPIIDTSSPEQKFNVSGDFITRLPMSSRQNWESMWFLVPGAVTIGRNGPDGVNFDAQIHGASERSNVYKLDGFDIGNSFTQQGWTTQFSTEAIQDVTIKTSGPDASTPLGEGGYMGIVTKSGGNEFHGSAAFFLQPRSFNGNNVPGGTTLDQKLYQPEGSIGGPIIKDRTWFFATYRYVNITQGVPRTAAVLQSFTDNGFEKPDYDLEERNHRFTGKITHKLTDNHTLTFNYLNDSGLTLNSDSRDLGTQETTIDIHNGGPTYQGMWTATLTPRLLLTAQYGYRRINGDVDFKGGNNPAIQRFSTTTISAGNLAGQTLILLYGNRASFASGSSGVRDHHEMTTDLSYVKDGWLGQHGLQAGIQYKPQTRINSDTVYPESGNVFNDEVRRVVNGVTSYQVFHRQFRTPTEFPGIVGTTNLFGFYFQDKWQPQSRLTLTYGVRFDRQGNHDAFDVVRLSSWSTDPRVGVAYSLTKDGRDAVRVSYARIHDIVYNQAAPSFGNRTPEIRDEWDNDLNGTFETTRVTASVGITGPPTILNRTVDPDLHANYLDEFHVGYTRQLPYRMVFDFGYINRNYKDVISTIDTNIIYQNNQFLGYKDPNFDAILQSTNLKNATQRYQALEFSLIRNLGGRFQAFASYTYQHQVDQGDFKYDDITGYLNPREWYRNDQLARPHLLRLNGSVYLPYKFTAAMIFSYQSGAFGGALVKDLAATDPEVAAHGPRTLTLSNGRVVNNPLFTTRRLVGPRGDNQLQLGNIPRLNLRFGKEFHFNERHMIEANVDFFNITNDATQLFFTNGTNTSATNFGLKSSTVQSPFGAQLSVRYRF